MRRKAGRVYVMSTTTPNVVKVGFSCAPEARLGELRAMGAVALLHASQIHEDARAIEQSAHRLLALAKRRVSGELFRASLDDAVEAIERAERIANGLELPLDAVTPAPFKQVNVRLDEATIAIIHELRRCAPPPIPSISDVIRSAIEEMYYREFTKVHGHPPPNRRERGDKLAARR